MKKLLIASLALTLSSGIFAADDFSIKRHALAVDAINQATALVNAVNRLAQIKAEITQTSPGGAFLPVDFSTTTINPLIGNNSDLMHANDWNMNNLINTVAPGIQANLQSTLPSSTVKYIDILNTVKK